MQHFLLGLLLCGCVQSAIAQQTSSIEGKLITSATTSFAIFLKRSTDSSLVKMEVSGVDKQFRFDGIAEGNYFIEVLQHQKQIGLATNVQVLTSKHTSVEITVAKPENTLQELKISSTKNVIERKADKIIYNVENSLEAPSNDALQVLQKAPGLQVDAQGNISMRGKRGVTLLINGKRTFLSGAALENVLRTTTASQIAKIEVISNPSSKYDAEGNAGIVNIILKKEQRIGKNAQILLSAGHGYFHKSAQSIQGNVRGKKMNLFASYANSNNKGFNDLRLYRKFYTLGALEGAYNQSNYLRFPSFNHTVKTGFDYTVNQNIQIGCMLHGSFTSFTPNSTNKSLVENGMGMATSYYASTSMSKEKYTNYSANVNGKKTLDTLGSELSMDMDYANYTNTGDQRFDTRYFTMNNIEFLSPYLLQSTILGSLDIKAGKIDYVKVVSNKRRIEFGIKSSLVHADNNLSYYDVSNVLPIFDSNQSNHFLYTEQIHAAYANHSIEQPKWNVQLGLRAEQTIANGKQVLNGKSFNRNYVQLFPSLFLQYKPSTANEFGFSFSRRIQRPSYDLMNPIRLFIDATTYKEGNPFLVPQHSYILEVSNTYQQKFTSTLSASYIYKSITEVLIPAENQNNITVQTNKNIGRQTIYSYNFSAPIQFATWWKSSNEISLYYSRYVGELAFMPIQSGVRSFNAKTIHTLTMPKAYTLQMDAFYQFRERYSFSSIEPFGAVQLSVQKSFNQKRSNVKLSLNDIFYTSRFRGSSSYTNYHEEFYVQRDSRTVVVAFTHRYGKQGTPANRRRSGAEEEKQRATKNG